MNGIYILHFEKPVETFTGKRYGNELHYVGQSIDLKERIRRHKTGMGSTVTKAAYRQRIKFTVFVFKMLASYENESEVTKKVEKYCPMCEGVYGKDRRINGFERILNAT